VRLVRAVVLRWSALTSLLPQRARVDLPATRGEVSLAASVWKPTTSETRQGLPAVVIVHQWSILGGQASLMHGIARELSERGLTAVTFDHRGVGGSSGTRTIRGISEVEDVEAVLEWAHTKLERDLVLLGSSAGAPIAGSALDRFTFVKGYVAIGYVFGLLSSVLFSCHYDAIVKSSKPKLFIMGTKDEFTSPAQLQSMLDKMSSVKESHLVEGIGHFTLESEKYDGMMAELTRSFVLKHCASAQ